METFCKAVYVLIWVLCKFSFLYSTERLSRQSKAKQPSENIFFVGHVLDISTDFNSELRKKMLRKLQNIVLFASHSEWWSVFISPLTFNPFFSVEHSSHSYVWVWVYVHALNLRNLLAVSGYTNEYFSLCSSSVEPVNISQNPYFFTSFIGFPKEHIAFSKSHEIQTWQQ